MTDHPSGERFCFCLLALLGWIVTGCTTIHPVMSDDPPAASETLFSHDDFGLALNQFVDDRGRVDYRSLQEDPADLDAYYRLIARISPDSHPERFPDEAHQLAYWINAYNAAAIKTVLTYYPIESVLDVKNPTLFFFLTDKAGFFFFQRLTFGGQTTSRYYLENQVIRQRFDDPRIHFALNCASIACPRLPRRPFWGDALDRQLDQETRLFLSEARNFRIDHNQMVIYLSSIFQWYEEDFTGWYQKTYPLSDPSLLDFVALYLPSETSEALMKVAGRYEIRFMPYDWGLNDQNTSPADNALTARRMAER